MSDIAELRKKIRRLDLSSAVLEALHHLGGSGTNREIHDEVVKLLDLDDEIVELLHKEGSSKTELEFRLGFARTGLRKYGLLENSGRSVWSLTAEGRQTKELDHAELSKVWDKPKSVKEEREPKEEVQHSSSQPEAMDDSLLAEDVTDVDNDSKWREELYGVLLGMDPSAFERLFQRVLREDGFYQVDVTGRSGDGGIDVEGIIRISGFLSFRMLVQCKRYKGPVGAGEVRNFRGAMGGRTDKGLIVTTGHFTQAAKREATRDGVPEIDLIDGEQLIDKLKELSLGVKTKEVVVEQVIIDREWFERI